MTVREFLESRHKAEHPVFVKVLKALPKDRFDYRPHERSPSAAEVVWTLAREAKACCDLIDSGQVNWTAEPPPADPEAILSAFQTHYAALDERIGRLSESCWQNKAKLFIDGQLFRQAPVGDFLWYLFFEDSTRHETAGSVLRLRLYCYAASYSARYITNASTYPSLGCKNAFGNRPTT
jgi:hypothetical protein